MAGTGATAFIDFPGQQSYEDDHSLQVQASASASGNASTNSTLRVAWVIVIASLVILWYLGYTFKG